MAYIIKAYLDGEFEGYMGREDDNCPNEDLEDNRLFKNSDVEKAKKLVKKLDRINKEDGYEFKLCLLKITETQEFEVN